MLDIAFIIMFLIFIVIIIMNLYTENEIFGAIAGLWLIIIALAILVGGIQLQNGMTMTANGSNYTLQTTYTDLVLPFPDTASIIFGTVLIGLSIYILYKNIDEMV
jgi:hypothetical protein